MRYFLDGYNFLFRTAADVEDLKRSRDLFIRALAFKNRHHHLDITLFFDAKKEESYSASSQTDGIQILFCHGHTSADEAIVEEVHRAKNPKEITVVTGDKALLASILSLGAKALAPSAFLALVTKKPKAIKRAPLKKNLKEKKAEKKEPFSTLEEYYLFHFQGQGGEPIPLKKEILHPRQDEIESEFLRWLRLFSE